MNRWCAGAIVSPRRAAPRHQDVACLRDGRTGLVCMIGVTPLSGNPSAYAQRPPDIPVSPGINDLHCRAGGQRADRLFPRREVNWLACRPGVSAGAGPGSLTGLRLWIACVRIGLEQSYARAPFLACAFSYC